MAETILITFQVREDSVDAVKSGLVQALHHSGDPNLLEGRVVTDVEDATTLLVIQKWTSSEDFAAHMEAAGGFSSLEPVLRESPVVTALVEK